MQSCCTHYSRRFAGQFTRLQQHQAIEVHCSLRDQGTLPTLTVWRLACVLICLFSQLVEASQFAVSMCHSHYVLMPISRTCCPLWLFVGLLEHSYVWLLQQCFQCFRVWSVYIGTDMQSVSQMVFAIAITFAISSVKQWTSATLASTFGSVPGLQQTSCTSPCQALWPQWYNRDAGEACNTPVVALFGHCGDMNWQLLLDSTSGVGNVHIHVYTHMLWPLHEDVFHCNKGMMSQVLSPFFVCYNCRRDAQSCCSL